MFIINNIIIFFLTKLVKNEIILIFIFFDYLSILYYKISYDFSLFYNLIN